MLEKGGFDSDMVHSAAQALQRVTRRPYAAMTVDLNPDELVWSHVKRTGVARNPLRAGEKLEIRIEQQLQDVKKNCRLVRSFFEVPSVAYISDCWASIGFTRIPACPSAACRTGLRPPPCIRVAPGAGPMGFNGRSGP